jgi:ATP-grasp N-terminal domain
MLYIIESSVIGPAYTRQAANKLGLEVTYLSKISNQEGDALRQMLAGRVLQCDTEDVGAMAEIIRGDSGHRNPDGVMTFLDSRLSVCAELCRVLGVTGVDPAILTIKSKADVNRLIPEYVPPSLAFDARNAPEARLRQILSQARHGLIAKPALGAGARGYREIATEAEMFPATQLVDGQLSPALRPFDLVVQERVLGELVSLEGFVTQGSLHFLGATGRRKRGNSESVFIFPYDERIDGTALAKAKTAVSALVNRSGIQNGFFHSEFIIQGGDAWLIDANFGRPGGANLAEVFSASFTVDPSAFYVLVLSVNLFGCVRCTETWEKPRMPALGIAYGLPERGRLFGYEGLEDFSSRHTLAQNFGCPVDAMGESNWAWVGLLAGSHAAVRSDLARLRLRSNLGLVAPAWYGSFDFLEARP